MTTELITGPDDAGRRLDRVLRKALPELPLSGIHRLLRTGQVFLNSAPATGADRVQSGSVIRIDAFAPNGVGAGDFSTIPGRSSGARLVEKNILWETPDLLILNKPAGLAVHGPGKSLACMVEDYLRDLKGKKSLSFKSGPLHRLDQPTSGVIVFSKTLRGAQDFSRLIQEGGVKKEYLAILDGQIPEPALWSDPLLRDANARKTYIAPQSDARYAETAVVPLRVAGRYSLIRAEIRTGRTHQIRAQAGFHGHPLAGDTKYGGSVQAQGLLLHAYRLGFPDAFLPGAPAYIEAPLPARFHRRVQALFGSFPLSVF